MLLKPGGLSNPESVEVPEAGLLLFNTEGGVPELQVRMVWKLYQVTYLVSQWLGGVF